MISIMYAVPLNVVVKCSQFDALARSFKLIKNDAFSLMNFNLQDKRLAEWMYKLKLRECMKEVHANAACKNWTFPSFKFAGLTIFEVLVTVPSSSCLYVEVCMHKEL
jgi:hypothetical protein